MGEARDSLRPSGDTAGACRVLPQDPRHPGTPGIPGPPVPQNNPAPRTADPWNSQPLGTPRAPGPLAPQDHTPALRTPAPQDPGPQARPVAGAAHLQGLEDGLGAVLVGLFGRELRLLELQELAPEDLPRGGPLRWAARTPGRHDPLLGQIPPTTTILHACRAGGKEGAGRGVGVCHW